jgi:hypothetical protein
MFTHKGFTVQNVQMDFTGQHPEVMILTKVGGKQHTIRWVGFTTATFKNIQKDLKAILEDEAKSMSKL